MKLPKVFKEDPSDDTLPYRQWFHAVENCMKWHRTDFEDDIDKIIMIGGVMDGKAGTWYDARAEYMKKYFKVDEWNAFVSTMEERFLDRQEERKAVGKMRELKYKGDIASYLPDMETLNYKVCLVGTPWRNFIRDGLSEDLQYHLSTTKREPRNDIDYVESGRRVDLAMEEFLMLQKKHSSKDSSSGPKKKDKKRKCQVEGDQREDKPKDRGSGGKSGSKKPKKDDKTTGQTPVHTDKKKALEGIAPCLVEKRFEMGECARCGVDNHPWKFCRKPIVSSSSKGKKTKPNDDNPKDVSSAAAAGGVKPKAQVSAPRWVYEVDSNDDMIMD